MTSINAKSQHGALRGAIVLLIAISFSCVLQGQEMSASPLSSNRPLPQLTISKLIIEQTSLMGEVCEAEDRQSNITVRDLSMQRFILPNADVSSRILPEKLEETLRMRGRQILGLGGQEGEVRLLSLCDLRKMASELTRLHQQSSGLALSRVIIPPQEIIEGRLMLQVLEGRLESYTLRRVDAGTKPEGGGGRVAAEALKELLGPSVGKPLLSKDLERALLVAGEITAQQMTGSMRAGEQTMGTILDVEEQPQPAVQGSLSLDNYGSPTMGQNQLAGSLAYVGLFSPGDKVAASYFSSQDHSALHSYNLSYDTPVGVQGWRMGVRRMLTRYAVLPGVSRGQGLSSTAFASYPLQRELNARTDVSAGYSSIILSDTDPTREDQRQTGVVWLDLRGVLRDSSGSHSWGLGLSAGHLRFETQQTAETTELQKGGRYQVLNYDYKRQQLLGRSVDAVLSVRGQAASKNLDSYHKLSVGGVNGVRAFASGEASGDRGHIIRLELGYSLPQAEQRLAIFYDSASARFNHTPLTANATSNVVRLAGSGLQWEANWSRGVRLRAFVARPNGGDRVISSADQKRTRFGLDMSYAF